MGEMFGPFEMGEDLVWVVCQNRHMLPADAALKVAGFANCIR